MCPFSLSPSHLLRGPPITLFLSLELFCCCFRNFRAVFAFYFFLLVISSIPPIFLVVDLFSIFVFISSRYSFFLLLDVDEFSFFVFIPSRYSFFLLRGSVIMVRMGMLARGRLVGWVGEGVGERKEA